MSTCALAGSPARASSPVPSALTEPRATRALPALPEAPRVGLPEPTAEELEELDAVLGRLRSEDATTRESAATEVLEARPSWVAAIDRRMNAIADKANRDDMRRVLEAARTRARRVVREQLEAAGKRGKVETPDYLTALVADAQPRNKAWQDMVAVAAMMRMLATIGTVEAARELIDVHTRFGEFVRVDVQLQLAKMGDKAVAALIEARKHKAEKIAKWAARQLDGMGKAIPSEAVQTEDHQVLADVLRAYGRVRDPDAARIVISFANTERAQVREAARQAVAMMGEVAAWQLRDSYEDLLGKKPPRDWTWDRTARELFGELDRQRLAQVHALFEEGTRARSEGRLDAMREAYDKVLTRSPTFEHREEMAQGYLELARKKLDEDRPAALAALRRAGRLSRDHAERQRIESLALTLEGEELAARGVADQVLFNRALELDPENGRAKEALARLARGETGQRGALRRWAGAAAIALGALVAMLVIALRRGKPEEARPEEGKAPEGDAAGSGEHRASGVGEDAGGAATRLDDASAAAPGGDAPAPRDDASGTAPDGAPSAGSQERPTGRGGDGEPYGP